jgi:hypothetical protein
MIVTKKTGGHNMSVYRFLETMGHLLIAFSENAIQHYTTFKASIWYLS